MSMLKFYSDNFRALFLIHKPYGKLTALFPICSYGIHIILLSCAPGGYRSMMSCDWSREKMMWTAILTLLVCLKITAYTDRLSADFRETFLEMRGILPRNLNYMFWFVRLCILLVQFLLIRFRAAASLLLPRNALASPPSPHPSPRQEIPLHPIRHFKTAVTNKTGWRNNCAHPCNCFANLYHRCRWMPTCASWLSWQAPWHFSHCGG